MTRLEYRVVHMCFCRLAQTLCHPWGSVTLIPASSCGPERTEVELILGTDCLEGVLRAVGSGGQRPGSSLGSKSLSSVSCVLGPRPASPLGNDFNPSPLFSLVKGAVFPYSKSSMWSLQQKGEKRRPPVLISVGSGHSALLRALCSKWPKQL